MTTHFDSSLDEALAALAAGPDFTRALHHPDLDGSVSAVIATYNRCPHDPGTRLADNPLAWALDSLLAQHGTALGEVVVVDDGSTDHTPAVLRCYQRKAARVPVRVLRLSVRRGVTAARNAGLGAARGRWVLFSDDDCVSAPDQVAGAAHVMGRLQREDPAAAAVMLPFYYRDIRPRHVVAASELGRLEVGQARLWAGFHAWPGAYLPDPPLLAGGPVVAPLPVQVIAGTALMDAAALAAIGGCADASAWRSAYPEHLYLSADLTDAGYTLYHCPDPRLGAAHLKFGAAGRFTPPGRTGDENLPGVGRTLAELIDLARRPADDTGNRVPDELFHPEMVGSFFAFWAWRSPQAGHRWAVRVWEEFVIDGQVYSQTVTTVPPRPARQEAWREGLARGARFLADTPARGLPDGQVQHLLNEVCATVGQPPITGW
ncbi:glycosyltransferase family 2 protein [Streptosporangium sp. NPDC087985]|uniref:glycosyltransferase family 2 protein n=1 Tax=Streptosporangium sp. NPDC087985 TaxID=3366196 RepID=UPI0038179364